MVKKDIKNVYRYHIKSLDKIFLSEYIISININQKKLIKSIKISKKIYLLIPKFFDFFLKTLATEFMTLLNKR